METIPLVSIGTTFRATDPDAQRAAVALGHALRHVGFAYIADHGVPQATLDAVFEASRAFHESPMERKQALGLNVFHRGYIGDSALRALAKNSNAQLPALNASLMIMHELAPDDPDLLAGKPLQGPNQWPDWLPGFRPAVTAYTDAIDKVARRLVQMIAVVLGLEQTALDAYFDKPTTFLRLLHYPSQPADAPANQFGFNPHTDFGVITLLAQRHSGLQVKPRGRDWIEAPPVEGTFVLNIGDMLARWTNGILVSTPHRVLNRGNASRLSVPYFFDPNMDAVIDTLPGCAGATNPSTEPPVRYGDYALGRIDRYGVRTAAAATANSAETMSGRTRSEHASVS